ncbi:hypothetical protein GOV11_02765 [Candidatus Woesearchaeota archaeon]|nr:hypothetical protein [Candidatus Woesearchaeota archaeon]
MLLAGCSNSDTTGYVSSFQRQSDPTGKQQRIKVTLDNDWCGYINDKYKHNINPVQPRLYEWVYNNLDEEFRKLEAFETHKTPVVARRINSARYSFYDDDYGCLNNVIIEPDKDNHQAWLNVE